MSARLKGQPAAPGVALAPAFVIERSEDMSGTLPERREGSADDELTRLDGALVRTAEELTALAEPLADEIGEEDAEIFLAHAAFASDPELRDRAESHIREGASAERAVVESFGGFRDLLAASDSEYLAARAEDLDDVRDRIVAILRGVDTASLAPEKRSVIAAETLTPSQTVAIPRATIAAIVTATGSPTSHAAILARALGVPAVVAAGGLMEAIRPDVQVAVDGRSGEIVISPDPGDLTHFEARVQAEERERRQLAGLRDIPGATANGHRVELAANIGSRDDLSTAVEARAEGSGLVRTEFLFLDRSSAPTTAEQIDFYREVAIAFPGHRVVFRTLDIGADKPLPFVERDAEPNPALGVRGIRLGLERPELLRDQLRALLRTRASLSGAEAGDVAIMFPLVTVPAELVAARRILDQVAGEEGVDTDGLEVGAMIEVPMAALATERIARHADFLSIGTNDLLQYMFAADRLVGDLAELTNLCEPEMLRLLGDVVEGGHRHGAWVGMCGEAASEPSLALALTGLGVDELSMTGTALPQVKATLRAVTKAECRRTVEAAIGAASGEEAREILERALQP